MVSGVLTVSNDIHLYFLKMDELHKTPSKNFLIVKMSKSFFIYSLCFDKIICLP